MFTGASNEVRPMAKRSVEVKGSALGSIARRWARYRRMENGLWDLRGRGGVERAKVEGSRLLEDLGYDLAADGRLRGSYSLLPPEMRKRIWMLTSVTGARAA